MAPTSVVCPTCHHCVDSVFCSAACLEASTRPEGGKHTADVCKRAQQLVKEGFARAAALEAQHRAIENSPDIEARGVERLGIIQPSLEITRIAGDTLHECKWHNDMGQALHSLGQYQKALRAHYRGLVLCPALSASATLKNASICTMMAYSGMGTCYVDIGESGYRNAARCFEQQIALAKGMGDTHSERSAYANLGIIYSRLQEYDKAIQYHTRDLALSKAAGDKRGEGQTNNNLGLSFLLAKRHEAAVPYFRAAAALARESSDPMSLAIAVRNEGVCHLRMGAYEAAFKVLEQYVQLVRDRAARYGATAASGTDEVWALNKLGEACAGMEKWEDALALYTQCSSTARSLGADDHERTAYEGMDRALAALGRPVDGADHAARRDKLAAIASELA